MRRRAARNPTASVHLEQGREKLDEARRELDAALAQVARGDRQGWQRMLWAYKNFAWASAEAFNVFDDESASDEEYANAEAMEKEASRLAGIAARTLSKELRVPTDAAGPYENPAAPERLVVRAHRKIALADRSDEPEVYWPNLLGAYDDLGKALRVLERRGATEPQIDALRTTRAEIRAASIEAFGAPPEAVSLYADDGSLLRAPSAPVQA